MSYLEVAFICISTMIIAIVHITENEQLSVRRKWQFAALALLISFGIILDTVCEITNDGNNIWVFKALKILEFLVTPIIPILLAKMIANKRFWNKVKKYYVALISTNTLIQLATFVFPITIAFDDNGRYIRTRFTCVYGAIVITAFIIFLLATRNKFNQNINRNSVTIYLVNILLLVGLSFRVVRYQSNADWLTITIAYLVFMIYFNNEYLKVDHLTSLLNQRVFKNRLYKINYNTAIVVIDANCFKRINDECGHQMGDVALRKISEAILNVYGNIGYCFRTGGDEFCVVLKPKVLDHLTQKDHNIYTVLNGLIMALDKKIDNMTKETPILKYGVSQGYAIYYENSSIENFKSITEVLQAADINMYAAKAKRKQQQQIQQQT